MEILEVANKDWCFKTRQTKKQGGTPLSRSTIYKIFTSPFYYGYFEYPIGSSLWYKGNHTPMITEEEYDKVQALLGRKGKPRPARVDCRGKGCPSIYRTKRGTFIVQGMRLKNEERSQIHIASEEEAVEISEEIMQELIAHFRK